MMIAAIAVLWLQGAWATPRSLILDGHENLSAGKETPFRITLSQGKMVLATQRGIGDWEGGITRLESNTQAGFLTWTESGQRALRLASTSHPDILTWFQPVRFSKAAVAAGAVAGWTLGTAEDVAGRPCWKLKSSTNPSQTLWIDQALGLTLKQEDASSKGGVLYRRTVNGFQLDTPVSDFVFTPASKTTIQGVPHPSILVRNPLVRPISAYAADLKQVIGRSKLQPELWMKRLAAPAGFEYVGTHFRESAGKPVSEVWPRNQLGGAEFEPGGLPPGWGAKAEISEDGRTVQIRFTANGGPGPMVVVLMPTANQGYDFSISIAGDERVDIKYTAFLDKDGSLVMGNGNNLEEAKLRREAARLDLSKASIAVQTDFLLPDSGHTLSLFQARGRDWKTCALFPKLDAPTKLNLQGTDYETWSFKGSFPLNIVAWTANGTSFALASSSLPTSELAGIAGKLEKAN